MKQTISDFETVPRGTREQLRTTEQRLENLRREVKRARIYAGENLPAAPGLVLVQMLEKAMKETLQ